MEKAEQLKLFNTYIRQPNLTINELRTWFLGWGFDKNNTDFNILTNQFFNENLFEIENKEIFKTSKKMIINNLNQLPERKYIVKEMGIETGVLMAFVGIGGVSKTMLLQDFLVSVSSGQPWLGMAVTQGPCVHIDQEQSLIQTERRYCRLMAGKKIDAVDIDRVTLATRLDADGVNRDQVFKEMCELLSGKLVCAIDSLRKISAADENSGDQEPLVALLKDVAGATGCTIIIIHHMGKIGASGATQSGRGSSTFYDSLDYQFDITRDSDERIKLFANKTRDEIKDKRQIYYKLVNSGEFNVKQNCSSAVTVTLCENQKQIDILETLKSAGDAGMSFTDIQSEVGGRLDGLQKSLKKLIKEKKIAMTKVGKYHMYNILY